MLRYALVMTVLATAALAADHPTVTAVGNAETRLAPDVVRFSTAIQEKGGKLDDLMKTMKARTDEVEKKLKAIPGAAPTLEEPEATAGGADLRTLSPALQRLKQIKQTKEGEEVALSVRVSVDVALPTSDVSSRIARVAELKRQVTEVLKAPAKDEDGTPEEDESAAMMRMAQGEAARPGQVTVLYVKRPGEDVVRATLKDAYARAEATGRLMAEAAGLALGPVVSMMHASPSEGGEGDPQDYMTRQVISQSGSARAKEPGELVGLRLLPLTYRASLAVTFELKPKSP